MPNLIQELISQNYLKTSRIINAFKKIRREDFVPENLKQEAKLNMPLPIGYGQTISQPLTVAFMLELLQPQTGDKILDVGSGSGWVTALLGQIVGKKGKVYAVELITELKEFGEENIAKYSFIKKGIVEFFRADATKGLPSKSPFDKIHVAAAAKEVPQPLKEQLKIGGKLIIPIGEQFSQDLILIEKEIGNKYKESHYCGFAFVPLIKT